MTHRSLRAARASPRARHPVGPVRAWRALLACAWATLAWPAAARPADAPPADAPPRGVRIGDDVPIPEVPYPSLRHRSRHGKPEWALLPTTSFNPDDGFGAGAFGDFRLPASLTDTRPYRLLVGLNAKAWLKPRQTGWEATVYGSFFPTPSRDLEITTVVSTFGRPWDWWFGVGQDTVRDATRRQDDDRVRDYFHRVLHSRVRLQSHLFQRFAGPLDLLAGLQITWNRVVVRPDTLLESQQGGLDGVDGGWTIGLDGGFRIDTRDNRIDPLVGGLILGVAQLDLGPQRPWGRAVLDLRVWRSVPAWRRHMFVFAAELIALASTGPVPFYELGVIPGYEMNERALTGVLGARGVVRGRLRAPLGLLGHGEVRLRPPGFHLFRGLYARLMPLLWADGVRVDHPKSLGGGWAVQPGFGTGVRLVVNEVTVTRLDLGTGPERVLTPDGMRVQWPFGVYATVGHTF